MKNISLILLLFGIFIAGFLTANLWLYSGTVNKLDINNLNNSLSQTDIKFLEKHVYGVWKITKQVEKLDESGLDFNKSTTTIKNITYGTSSDKYKPIFAILGDNFNPIFSSNSVMTSYIHPLGETPVYFDVNDIYLFGLYGGFNLDVVNPIYQISTIDAKEAMITDLMCYGSEQRTISLQSIFDIENVIKITYDLGETSSYVKRRNFGDILYVIDENDCNTLYLDFCGLWEMKRAEPNDEIPSSIKSHGIKG